MATRDFDQKNREDFDRNTAILNDALMKMAGSSKIKASISELARISGIHRNTIRDRGWPLERIEAIKKNRQLDVYRQKLEKEKSVDPLSVLSDRLEASRVEVIHWFNKCLDAEKKRLKTEDQLAMMKESRDTYMNSASVARQEVWAKEAEIEKLRSVIQVLESARDETPP
ncbi:hypothetical protein JQF37_12525 [Pseudomonas sp. MIL9]|uniref:hypothetical protein n=1 Tax=Pseudomonas sp. MIL9 TaxID=2807620 RepID=UPI001950B26B|nr:hypothetical protein [Pseudomonas sp. MIL9]MBM6444443.1 hypothetical protein [Pseudomonas sp. MIL9]